MKYPKLKNYIGYIAELNNGDRYIIVPAANETICLVNQMGWISIYDYDEKLKSVYNNKFDIDAIILCNFPFNLDCLFNDNKVEIIWERDDVLEVTMKEIEAKFGCRVKIVKEQNEDQGV